MSHTIQYDMGLRLWVLSGPTGQILQTYFSRASALQDRTVLRIIEGGGELRIRNADGTVAPTADVRNTQGTSKAQVPTSVGTSFSYA